MIKKILQIPTKESYINPPHAVVRSNYVLIMLYDTDTDKRIRREGDGTYLNPIYKGYKSHREMMSRVKSRFKNLKPFKPSQNCGIYDDPYGEYGFQLVMADDK